MGTPLAGPGQVPPLVSAHVILGNVAKRYGIWVPPTWTWPGTPPPGVCSMAFWVMLQSIMGYGYPPRCGLTNKVKLLPSRRTTHAGGNKVALLVQARLKTMKLSKHPETRKSQFQHCCCQLDSHFIASAGILTTSGR